MPKVKKKGGRRRRKTPAVLPMYRVLLRSGLFFCFVFMSQGRKLLQKACLIDNKYMFISKMPSELAQSLFVKYCPKIFPHPVHSTFVHLRSKHGCSWRSFFSPIVNLFGGSSPFFSEEGGGPPARISESNLACSKFKTLL